MRLNYPPAPQDTRNTDIQNTCAELSLYRCAFQNKTCLEARPATQHFRRCTGSAFQLTACNRRVTKHGLKFVP